ncbi:RNA 2',3'-cyclic phosphodiesterase [Dyadobacter alkalitolerans]|uniref:RNA 2',3'-cyclic phosphodiesterase n=1 Tax=Dyadobacter alkalitolerans TaxID=492736 RepID=UPI0004117A82|nr:RNA 2',3'-cyclic phosphodiesterase [Dyadobacter alkalitolerans]
MRPNRLFIGVDVGLDTAEQIQEQLPDLAFLKRQALENYHITLLFLGTVNELARVLNRFETISFDSFLISIDGIQGFYKKDKLHVVYLSVADGLEALTELNNQVKALFPEYSSEQYPTFVPHITLCRNLKAAEIKMAEAIIGHQFPEPFQFEAFKIVLYDSVQFKFAAQYTHVASVGANP